MSSIEDTTISTEGPVSEVFCTLKVCMLTTQPYHRSGSEQIPHGRMCTVSCLHNTETKCGWLVENLTALTGVRPLAGRPLSSSVQSMPMMGTGEDAVLNAKPLR